MRFPKNRSESSIDDQQPRRIISSGPFLMSFREKSLARPIADEFSRNLTRNNAFLD
jgi:hypothetical protein